MAERKTRRRAGTTRPVVAVRAREADEAERSLGRVVALGLPVVSVVGAIVVGAVASVGSALLVLASGALLGTIALLWASVRTLSGDAPLPTDLEAMAARRHGVDALAEEKRRVLRALKDIESEHAIGKIDDADYATFVAQLRDDAKAVMRQMDLEVAPLRDEAERIAREYLAKRGLGAAGATAAPAEESTPGDVPGDAAEPSAERLACGSCDTSNEPDATFCKQCGSAIRAGGGA
jgi:hypothetical protein